MTPFINDPLMPHLMDIASNPASEGLILAGGFGIRLKQSELQGAETRTLIMPFPAARATQDMDFFLRIEMFVQKERGKGVRNMLDQLEYREKQRQWQFEKMQSPDTPERHVIVDLLARDPDPTEEPVKTKDFRVGSGAKIGIHGHETPEAFAVEDSPQPIRVTGLRTDGQEVEATIFVPHPFASLSMKVTAAHDWLRYARGELTDRERSEKHAFDVYALVAMLTEQEQAEAVGLAAKYAEHPLAQANKGHIAALYSSFDAAGFLVVRRQTSVTEADYNVFWEVLQGILGT